MIKDQTINVRVSSEFKQRINNAIKGRKGYTITRVLLEGAESVVEKLEKENNSPNPGSIVVVNRPGTDPDSSKGHVGFYVMENSDKEFLSQYEKILEAMASSPNSEQRVLANGAKAFIGVIKWWEDEVSGAIAANDIGRLELLIGAFTIHLAALFSTCLRDMPDEIPRRVLAYMVKHFEENSSADDVMPTREDIKFFDGLKPPFVN